MPETESMALLAEMFGALEAPRARDFVNETEALPDGRVQNHVLTRAILFALSGNASYGQLIHAISAYPNLMPNIDFGVVTDARPGAPKTNAYDVLALTSRLARIMGIEGYKDFDSTRHSIGPTTPEEGKAIPAFGFRDLPVWIIREGGRVERREMSITLDKAFGKIAYKDKLAELILLRDTSNYKKAAWSLTSSIIKESMGLDPRDPDPELYGTQLESIRGGAIRNWDELVDMCFPLTIAAQATLEVLNDGLELMRTAEGGHRQEHGRKLGGPGYFDLYSLSELETAAATDLLDIYPGHFSKFAKKLLSKVSSAFEGGFTGSYATRKDQAVKLLESVMFYQPRMIEADIIESSAIIHRLGAGTDGAQVINEVQSTVSTLPQQHLRPFDTWSELTRSLDRNNLEQIFQIGNNLDNWYDFKPVLRNIGISDSELSLISQNELRGVDGFYHFIDTVGKKGAEIFDWSKLFDARAFGNAIRYAEKVVNTIEAFQQAGNKLADLIGTLPKRSTQFIGKAKQVQEFLYAIDEFGGSVLEIIGQAKDRGAFFGFTEEGRMEPTVSHWLTGIERMFEVPKLTDKSRYYVMYNREDFIKSLGVNLNPAKIRHKDLSKLVHRRHINSAMSEEEKIKLIRILEEEITKMGCRWGRDEFDLLDPDSETDGQFLIGSSGRTLYQTYNIGDIYKMMGEDLKKILDDPKLVGESRDETKELYRYWKVCGGAGRFSLQHVVNRTSAGYANFQHWINKFQDASVISVRQQEAHLSRVKKLAEKGLIGVSGYTLLGGLTEKGWYPVLPMDKYGTTMYPVYSRPAI